jgi:hypothetical protein
MAAGWTFTTALSRLTLARAETLNALFTGIETGFASVESAKLSLTGGTMSGAIAMDSNKITGLDTPTADADAATKAYVDTSVDAAVVGTGPFSAIDVNGGTIDGAVIGGAVPAAGTFTSLTATSGSITGITDLAVADGGTGASTAAGALTNIGAQASPAYTTKSAGYTALATDDGAVINCTAALTLALTDAATLGAKWNIIIKANGGDVTIDPDAAETINGASTYVLYDGNSANIICDGSNFQVVHHGAIVTKWASYAGSITSQGLGTITVNSARSRRNGANLEIQVFIALGTTTAVQGRIGIGFNGTDGNVAVASWINSGGEIVGQWASTATSAISPHMLAVPSEAFLRFVYHVSGGNGLATLNGSSVGSSGQSVSIQASIPIEGW